jgi:hypothetical protein
VEDETDEVEYAIELLDRLLEAADGGRNVHMGSYGASTILALLMDRDYRIAVMSELDDFQNTELT